MTPAAHVVASTAGTADMARCRSFNGAADLPALARLLVACDADRYGEHYTLHYFRPARTDSGMRTGWDARLWEAPPAGETAGAPAAPLVACALVAGTSLHFHIHPAWRGGEIAHATMDWMEARGAELAREQPVTLSARCADNDAHRADVLQRRGFAPAAKHLLRMTRSLAQPPPDPQLPDGFTIQRLGEKTTDAQFASFAAAFNAAMGGGSAAQHWRERVSDPEGVPPIGLVGPDGAVAAVCVCRVYRHHNEAFGVREGWIEQMGTREEFRRRGLGRAALRAGLRLLRERGADTAVLETGSTNERSRPLYESEGFATVLRIHSYRKIVLGP